MKNLDSFEFMELTKEELVNIEGGSLSAHAKTIAHYVGAHVADTIDFWDGFFS
ncbi:hypothetical protein [Dysgonomonas termitidis]|uniref:Bacteriocin n=1 Tax=Dysgonomonas termitidis TaxID=1516126 RepID=A0ABV9KUT7_9BACT